MASKKGSSNAQKARYSRYESESRGEKNKAAKLKRHLKKFPNDKVAQEALKNPQISGAKKRLGRGVFVYTDKDGKAHYAGGRLTEAQRVSLRVQSIIRKAHNEASYTHGKGVFLFTNAKGEKQYSNALVKTKGKK